MDLKGMKRKELQALCKKHSIPANLSNIEMARRLSLALKSVAKVVKFCPENNETFVFEADSDEEQEDDHTRKRKRPPHTHATLRRSSRLAVKRTRSDTTDQQPVGTEMEQNHEPIQPDFTENLDSPRNSTPPTVSCDTNQESAVDEITLLGDTIASETPLHTQDEETGQPSLDIEMDGIGSQSRLTSEILLDRNHEYERSEDCDVLKEASKEVSRAAMQIDHTDDLDQIKSTLFDSDDTGIMDDKDNVEDDTGKEDAGSYDTDDLEAKLGDYHCEIATLNKNLEDLVLPQVEVDATHDCENVEHYTGDNANYQDADLSSEANFPFDISCKSSVIGSALDVSSPLGNKYGSPYFIKDVKGTTKKEVSVEDQGHSVAVKDKSSSCKISDDSSEGTDGLVMGYNVSTQEDIEELFDAKSVKSDDDLQAVEVLSDTCICTPTIQNMDADCFVPSPDNDVSKLHVRSAQFTRVEMNTSLQNDKEDDIKRLHEPFVEANMGSDAEENVMINEDVDPGFESQVGEHKHRTEPAVSQDLISGNKADVEDDVRKVDAGLYNTDYSEANLGDYDVEIVKLNQSHEDLVVPQVEVDAKHDNKNVENDTGDHANSQDVQLSSKANFSFDIFGKSPETYLRSGPVLNVSSLLGYKYGSSNFSKGIKGMINKEASAENKGHSVDARDKSSSCKISDDSLDATNELVMEHKVSNQGYIEPLFDNHKDAKSVKIDDDVLNDSCTRTPMRQNMDADCFIPSPDDGMSELHARSAEFTTLQMNMSLQNGIEDDMKILHEIFVEASIGSDAEECVVMNEDVDPSFKSQVSEQKHCAEAAVSQDLIPENRENLTEQDDVSAIIEEYMERETDMDSYAPLYEGSTTCVFVDLSNIAKPGGEEDDTFHAMTGLMVSKTDDAQTDSNHDLSVNHEVSENSIDASESNDNSYVASAKCTDNCEGAGVEDDGSFIVADLGENTIGMTGLNKDAATFDAYATSDKPSTESGGSTEVDWFIAQNESVEFDNSLNFTESKGESLIATGEPITECGADNARQVEIHSEETYVVRTPVSTKNDSSDNIGGTMELKNIASIANAEISYVALDEAVHEIVEKHNRPDIIQDNIDSDKNKDGIVELDKSIENTEIDGMNSVSKCDEQVNNVDMKPDAEGFEFPAVQGSARHVNYEFVQDIASSKSFAETANRSRKKNSDHFIPESFKDFHKVHDMKENPPITKTQHFGSITASTKSSKRRPLEDLQ